MPADARLPNARGGCIPLWALLLAAALLAGGCHKEARAPVRPPPLVTTTQAVARDVPVYVDQIGACTAYETVAIRPQASGQITGVHFVDGADLKKGDPLYTIDPRPYQAALDQAQGTLLQSRASMVLAKLLFEHAEVLFPLKATSKEDYQTKQNSIETTQALIKANEAAVETAKVNLAYCSIASPVDGRASKNLVDAGNVVFANSGTVMLTIQRLDPIYADFIVPERRLGEVRAEMARATLRAGVRLPTESPEQAREGDLTFLDNTVQEASGTIALRATLANADRRFWPGQFVQVRLVLRTLKGAVLVPSRATQTSQNGPFVYVVRPDSTAEMRLVKLGQPQGESVVVTEGLQAGEVVVTGGQLMVMPGGKVAVQPASASGPSTRGQGAATMRAAP